MEDDRPRLIEPTEALRDAYVAFVTEFRAAGQPFAQSHYEMVEADFGAFVRRLRSNKEGKNLPEGWVPSSSYWLVRGGRVLGVCNLRHALNENLLDFGGHVGYAVRPSERGKGYATLMLSRVIELASERGIGRMRVTCDRDNPASARVIEKCGGRLDSEGYSPLAGRVTRRYWIEVRNDDSNVDLGAAAAELPRLFVDTPKDRRE